MIDTESASAQNCGSVRHRDVTEQSRCVTRNVGQASHRGPAAAGRRHRDTGALLSRSRSWIDASFRRALNPAAFGGSAGCSASARCRRVALAGLEPERKAKP